MAVSRKRTVLVSEVQSNGSEKATAKRARQSYLRLFAFPSWLVLLAALLFAALVRFRLLQIPLERDEGEYAYAGQLLLLGIPPYLKAFNMKFPGTYAAYALIMAVFGQSTTGIHLGFVLVNSAATVLVFFLAKRLFGSVAASAACSAYALMSLGAGVYGTQGHATHLVVLMVLGASALLLHALDTGQRRYVFFSGLLYGLGVLMKQHGAFFAIFGAVYLLWHSQMGLREFRAQTFRRLAIFVTGVSVPLAITAAMLWSTGVFGRFWFWTFRYAGEYVRETPLSSGVAAFADSFSPVVGPNLLIWIVAAEGLALIWWKKEDRTAARFATSLLLFSFLAVCPGLFFRGHYFIMMLPAVALLFGAGVGSLQRFLGNGASTGLYLAVVFFSVFQQSDFLFRQSPIQVSRSIYWNNPFPEAIPVADYIRTHTTKDSRIVVLGSEPEIYFYAHRLDATGYIYTYALMEPQPYAVAMQNEMIRDIEAARPAYVVLGNVMSTWLVRSGSSLHIFEWWKTYSGEHYKKVGVAEVLSADDSRYRWDNVESYESKSTVLEVYRRKD